MPEFPFSLGAKLPLDRCPYCGVAKPDIDQKWTHRSKAHDDSNQRYWRVYQCSNCGGLVLAASSVAGGGQVTEMYPSGWAPNTALPERAQRFLGEAVESLNSPSAAIMVANSAVDEMLKAKGYTEGNLYPRINKAAEDNLITDEMAAWAHDVRLDANDQRHADQDAELPDQEDAQRCVEFAKALGEFLFVIPARVQRGREAVERAKGEND